jgi:hypothetical protein
VAKHRSFTADLRFSHAQMVNRRFPAAAFMVSNWWTRNSPPGRANIARQSKIYGESNQPCFPRFFGELSPKQSLAIYRQTLGEKRRRIDA